MRVLVVEHETECPPGLFGTWMAAAGAEFDVRRPYLGATLPEDLARHDALLVLGGAMNAVDEVVTPWLAPTKELVRAAVADAVPLLGICLGHQIIADALGGSVSVNPAGVQRDLLPVGWTEAVTGDPLFGSRPRRAPHWNGDIVSVPPAGAEVLATAPGGEVQVLRFAERAWGIQSHPEIDARALLVWAEQEGIPVVDFIDAVEDAGDELAADWEPVARAFVELGRGSSGR